MMSRLIYAISIALVTVSVISAAAPFAYADNGAITLRWNAGEEDVSFRAVPGGDCYLSIKGCHCTGQPGNPALPVKVYRIALPPDTNLKSVKARLTDSSGGVLAGSFSIAAANPYYVGEEGPFWGGNASSIEEGKNTAVYGSDEAFPSNHVKVHDTGQMRKWKFARIHFTPVQYRPVSGKIALLKTARIVVTYETDAKYAVSGELLTDCVFDEIAQRTFDNFHTAREWYEPSAVVSPASFTGEKGYAILTTPGVADSGCLDDFISHKESIGFTVYVQTSSHASWLVQNYASKHIAYALILAHPNTIDPGGCDNGFIDLTGDQAPEVFAGRFEEDDQNQHRTDEDAMIVPVGIEAITAYLQRVIEYETATDVEYRKKELFSNAFDTSFTNLISAGFSKAGGFEVTAGGGSAISSEWEDEPFGLIQQRSHGMTHSIKSHFTKWDCAAIPWTDKPAVVHIIACHTGEYTAHTAGSMNSITLCMLKTCAIAVMGNNAAATGWPSWDAPERGYVENLGWFFQKEICIHGATVGEAHCLGKFYATDFPQPDYATFNLKGDPSVRVQAGNELRIIARRPLEYARPGRTYKEVLGAVGGEKPYVWTLDSGTLPPGIQLLEDGTLIGTPSSAGEWDFQVKVTDATGLAVDVAQLRIDCGDSGIIDGSLLPDATPGQYYAYVLTNQQGKSTTAFAWSWSGDTPPGLTLSDTAGVISGTPTTPGTYTFTVSVGTASKEFTIRVLDPADLRIVTECLDNAAAGQPYSQTLKAAGGAGTYTWSLASGSLPPGLALGGSSGIISGTATTAGEYKFTVQVTDGTDSVQREFSMAVVDTSEPPSLQVISSSLPDGAVNEAYSAQLEASGGVSPYNWTVTAGSLPPGLSLSTGGTISGTPTAEGSYPFTVQVTDGAAGTAEKELAIVVLPAGSLIITTDSLPAGEVDSSYQATVEAAGGNLPYTWSISTGALPPGLQIDAGTGTISGTPGETGTFIFTVRVQDGASEFASKEFSLAIEAPVKKPACILPRKSGGCAISVDASDLGGAGGAILPYTVVVLVLAGAAMLGKRRDKRSLKAGPYAASAQVSSSRED